MANPIWKDYLVELGTGNKYQFRILLTNTSEVIYTGVAFKRPNETTNKIRINDICADWLSNSNQLTSSALTSTIVSQSFSIQLYISTSQGELPDWEDLTSVTFINDWSYDDSFNGTIMGYNFPIKTGTTTSTCDRYKLHYVNAYGGVDSFAIEGRVTESDNITRSTRKVDYNNSSSVNRGEQNYINEIEKKFSFHTGFLTDDESSRMHHLINSTNVVLEDILENTRTPVVITNSTLEYKTFKNQGGRMADYEIELRIAQDRVRR